MRSIASRGYDDLPGRRRWRCGQVSRGVLLELRIRPSAVPVCRRPCEASSHEGGHARAERRRELQFRELWMPRWAQGFRQKIEEITGEGVSLTASR